MMLVEEQSLVLMALHGDGGVLVLLQIALVIIWNSGGWQVWGGRTSRALLLQ